MSVSNTQRTLKYYKEIGYKVGMVERWIQIPNSKFGGIRRDLFNFIDIIGLDITSKKIVAIQSCGSAFSEHNKKITETLEIAESAKEWLSCGGVIILIGWRKIKKKRGGKAMIWSPRIKEYKLEDFNKF